MSRKRDSNWSKDEITVLLDSIMEITRTRSDDGKRTNSREVFEFAAKKMHEKGHVARAEREKCRTKWKKMKEEYTHAKRAREGDTRYKEAPGIVPFFERMGEFINGSFDNISPHSTIVRRNNSYTPNKPSTAMRASARLAANTNGTTSSTDTTSSTIVSRTNPTNASSVDYQPPNLHTQSNASSSSRQNSRLSSGSNTLPSTTTTLSSSSNNNHHQQEPQSAIPNGELYSVYTTYNSTSNNSNSSLLAVSNHDPLQNQSTENADISYRVTTNCRQITIFGDHDVDIKFRGHCVTINKIVDYQAAET